ncbi:MAG TPA: Ig-like domain-containing protein [Acidimicrobiales bacterium]|nr:Ig-like domain-containing protein [Acidimicrobiales bacterium]
MQRRCGEGAGRRRWRHALGAVVLLAFGLVAAGAGPADGLGPDVAGAEVAGAATTGNWAVATSASPPGLMANELNAVSCPAAGDCVGVGYSATPLGATALVETLVSGGWALVTTPPVPGAYTSELQGVSCTSASSCVAVGYDQAKGGSQQTLVETLAAGAWTVTTSPNQGTGNNQLDSISCPQAGACVAVGYYQGASNAAGNNQTPSTTSASTTSASTTSASTTSASTTSASNTSAGNTSAGTSPATGTAASSQGGISRALAMVLSAGSWTLSTAADAGSGTNVLKGISCTAAGTCVAVGYYGNAGVDRALTEKLAAGVWAVSASTDVGAGLNELDAVACTSSTSCASVGTFRTAAGIYQNLIETLGAAGWSPLAHSPDATMTNNELAGVSCTSSASCMAVGHYSNKGVAQSLSVELVHGSWTVTSNPDKGTSTNELSAVSCAPASSQCAAVGYFNDVISGYSDVTPQVLAEAWSGTSWATEAASDALTPDLALNGVSCSSSRSCVAVGSYESGAGARQVLVEDLANGAWAATPAPSPSAISNYLDAVSCPSSGSCVAVGYDTPVGSNGAKTDQALVERLSGGKWSVSPAPDQGTGYNQLNGVSCSSANSCVAVGFYSPSSTSTGGGPRVLIETLANGSWTLTPGPALAAGSSYLEGVSCPSARSCVAVGYYYNGKGRRALVESLTNGVWTVDRSPDNGSGDNLLDSVSCWSPASCVAVGYYAAGAAHLGLVETLGAGGWAITSAPEPSSSGDYPTGVSCMASGSCAVVGSYTSGPGGTVDQTLVEVIGIGAWTLAASPSPDAGGDTLGAVSCVALASCVAVGHFDAAAAQGSLVESGPAPVGVAQTTTTLSSAPNPAKVGQKVTYTATIVPAPAGGAVTFADNGAVVAGCRAVPVGATGKAKCSVTYQTVGENLVQAAFSGRSGFTPSTSALFSQLVIKPAPLAQGYWLATKGGQIFGVGAAKSLGSISTTPADPVVGISSSPRARGYWVVTANGTVAAFGGATFHGDLPEDKVKASDIVAIAPTANGAGYWLVGKDGGLFAFGNASYHGSVPGVKKHVSDIVGMVTSPNGAGYLLVGADGGVFAFGASRFYGSLPALHIKVDNVRAILPSPTGAGYVLVGSDGGAFLFGRGVSFHGSLPGEKYHVTDIVGLALTPDNGGYFMAGANGAVYGFGDAKVGPAPVGLGAHLPVVAIAGFG